MVSIFAKYLNNELTILLVRKQVGGKVKKTHAQYSGQRWVARVLSSALYTKGECMLRKISNIVNKSKKKIERHENTVNIY